MIINATVSKVDGGNKTNATAFDEHMAPTLRTHLRDEYVLDHEGIERVMLQLRQLYLKSACQVSASFTAPDANDDQKEMITRSAPHMLQSMASVAGAVQNHTFFHLADLLAAIDEKLHPRPKH